MTCGYCTDVCLNVVGGRSVGSVPVSEMEAGQVEVEVEVTAEISRLMQKMERAGVHPDGSTYSTLHGVWLRLENVPQAVGALAQVYIRHASTSGLDASTIDLHISTICTSCINY